MELLRMPSYEVPGREGGSISSRCFPFAEPIFAWKVPLEFLVTVSLVECTFFLCGVVKSESESSSRLITLEALLMTWLRRVFFDLGLLKRSQTGGGVVEETDDRELVVAFLLGLFLLGSDFGCCCSASLRNLRFALLPGCLELPEDNLGK
jgi:hypothetical protein